MRRALVAAVVVLLVLAALPATGQPFPDTVTLTSEATADTGFQAEGIVARGRHAWAGSLATGTVVRADLITGDVETVVEQAAGSAVGLALDRRRRLWVAGGLTGDARVYDADTGDEVATLRLATSFPAFVNDVTVTSDAAYLTDSFNAVLYRVPISGGGAIGDPEPLALTGDFEQVPGPFVFNSNGIVATTLGSRARLVLAQSTDPDGQGSALYVVEPGDTTAEAHRIDLDEEVSNADGLVLRGRRLYVVENRQNRIAEIALAGDLRRGTVTRRLTDDAFDVPTTASQALGALYAVNAKFGVPDPSAVEYEMVRVDLR